MLVLTLVLACIWIGGMWYMRRDTSRRGRRVQTVQGILWVECRHLPAPGQETLTYGHLERQGQGYDPGRAHRGRLTSQGGTYEWQELSHRRYA